MDKAALDLPPCANEKIRHFYDILNSSYLKSVLKSFEVYLLVKSIAFKKSHYKDKASKINENSLHHSDLSVVFITIRIIIWASYTRRIKLL